ncbi:PREDICTED: probable lipid desaturase ADS3.2, chloroplastic [Camelina sativa]|uniref:Probable lipid desaturase ADS3.2, chloroplastic n=1 Tax=Camelina sativa TaxID=90675 RepID=A0ABM0W4J2_CAMSA|nr:PREDICTED: probable lipid desaturase ADS3.2, chloroplastic [Camelina sativa]
MVSLSTTLRQLSHFPPFVKQYNPRNNNALFKLITHNSTNTFLSKRGGSVAHWKRTFVAVQCAQDQVESSWKIPLSEVVVVRKKREFWERSWTSWDVGKLVVVGGVHLLSLLAPFHFNWAAFRVFPWLVYINGVCITLSYHRNLSHRSFDLPKWLEYLCAYGGLLAFQGDPIEWVSNHRYHHKHCETKRDPHSPTQGFWFSHMTWIFDSGTILKKCGGHDNVDDLVRQPFYRFLQRTILLHQMAYALLFYFCGGMPFLVWGIGVATVVRLHTTFLVNSVCHVWGTRAWNTPDFSKNNWWVAIITFGEGWHNNHHAFEFSARQGLEWWQLDGTWYIIRFLEAIGLATNVKLPTESQKKRMALSDL